MTAALMTARRAQPLKGSVRAPGDKSISHRALILGALARGETQVEGLLEGEDVKRSAGAMRAFGAEVETAADQAGLVQPGANHGRDAAGPSGPRPGRPAVGARQTMAAD